VERHCSRSALRYPDRWSELHMAEIIARIASDRKVELTHDGSTKLSGTDPLAPHDAAFLARGILSCAAALSGTNPPPVGALTGDTHLPIMGYATGTSSITGDPVLILSVPPGIELTFVMPLQTVRELGAALVAEADGTAPLGGRRGTVH
jgi:hypothetical protein